METFFAVCLIVLGIVGIIGGATKNEEVMKLMQSTSRLLRLFSEDSLPTAVIVVSIIFIFIGAVVLIH